MDAKSKANFINSVAGGQTIPCPSCNNLNDISSSFCIYCGSALSKANDKNDEVKVTETKQKNAFRSVPVSVSVSVEEEVSVFAQGLPSWDIVPPQVMVRRNRKK